MNKGIKIKQTSLNFQDFIKVMHSKACISKKNAHYPIASLILNALKPKRDARKKV